MGGSAPSGGDHENVFLRNSQQIEEGLRLPMIREIDDRSNFVTVSKDRVTLTVIWMSCGISSCFGGKGKALTEDRSCHFSREVTCAGAVVRANVMRVL